MRTRFSRGMSVLVAAGLAAAACGPADEGAGGDPGVATLKAALPSAEDMTIRMPSEAFLAPEQAVFYGFTRGITLHVNRFVYVITNIIEDVVSQPPTETDGETYAVWGPYGEPLAPAVWRVRVDRVGAGRFEYVVEGWPRDADAGAAVTVLRGTHEEGDGPRRGRGSWTYDLTAGHGLDPVAHEATGAVAVQYDVGAARSLEVRFDQVQGPGDPMANSALYRYTESADGAGTFDFISNLDIHADDQPELDRRELLRVRSRWLPAGPGRADVIATHGDLPGDERVDAIECWDEGFLRTYVQFAYGGLVQEEGDAAACPYADRQEPRFEGFDADAFADGDLVAALPDPVDVAATPAPVAEPVAEPASYYVLARDTVVGLVTHTRGVLELVRRITRHPPSDCEPEGCTWGPWTDWNTRVSFRLAVRREEGEAYAFRAETKRFGQPEEAWRTILEGGFVRAAEGEEGQGWFLLDLDAVAAADPNEQGRGTYRAEYANRADRRELYVRLERFVTAEVPEPMDARYFLVTDADGGRLDLRFPANIDGENPDRPAREQIDARVRWLPGGAGTGNARVTGGDLAEGAAALGVECWDDTAALTHRDVRLLLPGQEGLPTIDPDACAFDDWQAPDFPPMADEG